MPQDSTSSFADLQQAFDKTSYALNKRLVRLLLIGQNDITVPASEFDIALERLQDVRTVINLLETWIVDNAPT